MRALIVVGLGFGDEGKGGVVDYLVATENAELTVFFNGGSQRAHNVVLEDGRHHTFSQFGSGTLRGCPTYHSRYSLINPLNLIAEGRLLESKGVRDPFGMVRVDAACPIITPFHVAANRLREIARGDSRHGSCGEGIGETAHDHEVAWADCLTAGDIVRLSQDKLAVVLAQAQGRKLGELARDLGDLVRSEPEWIKSWTTFVDRDEPLRCAEAYKAFVELVEIVDGHDLSQHETVVFEGSQGVLLDEWYGFHPYTTWSTCTFANAMELLAPYIDCTAVEPAMCARHDNVSVTRIGVTRAYGVRHGPGPFPTESLALTLPEPHNARDPWQGPVRTGYTDTVLLRYAVDACGGIDALAVTCLDLVPNIWQVCDSYRLFGTRVIPHIRHVPDHDLGDQAMLGGMLTRDVVPQYRICISSELPGILGTAANAPVLIESYGPTASDKRALKEARS